MNYVYEGPYAQLVELSVPEGLARGTPLPLRAKLDYLACTDEICVPQTATVALDLKVGEAGGMPERQAEFDRYRQALPRPLGSEGRFERAEGRLRPTSEGRRVGKEGVRRCRSRWSPDP